MARRGGGERRRDSDGGRGRWRRGEEREGEIARGERGRWRGVGGGEDGGGWGEEKMAGWVGWRFR